MYLLNVYSIFKVREVFALNTELGKFRAKIKRFFKIFF